MLIQSDLKRCNRCQKCENIKQIVLKKILYQVELHADAAKLYTIVPVTHLS